MHEGEVVSVVRYHGHSIGVVQAGILLVSDTYPGFREYDEAFNGAGLTGFGLVVIISAAFNITRPRRVRKSTEPRFLGALVIGMAPVVAMLAWNLLGSPAIAFGAGAIAFCYFGVTAVTQIRKDRRATDEAAGDNPVVKRSSGGRLWNW